MSNLMRITQLSFSRRSRNNSSSSSSYYSRSVLVVKRLINSNNAVKQQQQQTTTRTKLKVSPLVLVSLSLVTGFAVGRLTLQEEEDNHRHRRVLPSGLPRSCCDDTKYTNNEQQEQQRSSLPSQLMAIVGNDNIIDGTKPSTTTIPFLKGARLGGEGQALAIVTPRTLSEVVRCVQLAIAANCVVLPQGSNTGLTGGSVPRPNTGDDRPVVIINCAKHLTHYIPMDGGKRILCWAGVGLATLSRELPQLFPDRESHSILGSTFLNPTTAAGVAFGSGGTQLRKGPAYTDRALYIKVTKDGRVKLVNTLGIDGIDHVKGDDNDDYAVVKQLDSYQQTDDGNNVESSSSCCPRLMSSAKGEKTKASMTTYAGHICKQDKHCSRYNSNCEGLECNRSEGKVLILATVHDTFPIPTKKKDFWLSFDSLETAYAFRREVCLDNPKDLPVSLEYMDRDSFDVIDRSGRGQGFIIQSLGVSSPYVKTLWNVKLWIESLPLPYANIVCDKFLHLANPIFPPLLPRRIQKTGKTMNHHVAMTVGEYGDGNMENLLQRLIRFEEKYGKNNNNKVVLHECQSKEEVAALTAFRFVAASAFRTYCVGEGLQGVSVDYALPKNYSTIPDLLPSTTTTTTTALAAVVKRMRYSHFGCNVVHEDIAFRPDADAEAAKLAFKKVVEDGAVGGKLPAEHGHGTEYHAPKPTQTRWKKMDPLNVFNPGVGGLSYKYKYKE